MSEVLDRSVADQVWGVKGGDPPKDWEWWGVGESGDEYARLPAFSEKWEFAMRIVERMLQDGWQCSMYFDDSPSVNFKTILAGGAEVSARVIKLNTMPTEKVMCAIICEAALKARKVKK